MQTIVNSKSRFFRLRGKGPESGKAFQADMERFHTNIQDEHEKAAENGPQPPSYSGIAICCTGCSRFRSSGWDW